MWLIDAYRTKDALILWLKDEKENIRLEKKWKACVYIEDSLDARAFIKKHNLIHIPEIKQTYLGKKKNVLTIQVPKLGRFNSFVRWIERKTEHRIPLYNADVLPEQAFLAINNLTPFSSIRLQESRIIREEDNAITDLTTARIRLLSKKSIISSITLNSKRFEGEESDMLIRFKEAFEKIDPDIILMDHAFASLPILAQRLQAYQIDCKLHRWDPVDIRYRGGKSFYSYGQVRYRDFAIRLHGRLLLDTESTVVHEADIDAIIELCRLTGTFFQQVASKSFGASFQQAIVRELLRSNSLVPFKEKPIDPPISLLDLLKADRAGHTLDPKIGFHKNVAELDFCSMYPWIMYNHNISAETILSRDGPIEMVPGIGLGISLKKKGLVPRAIKPILDKRMLYKRQPENKAKAAALKWVLVTSYGYLRFREFKLGVGRSHMAVGAYARKILLDISRLAEDKGFDVIHGIIDSLYIKKTGMEEDEVKDLCKDIEALTGIPISFEGIFRWIVFLPSINNPLRPVPARYFGVFRDGTIKARGIELRQHNTPPIIKDFQGDILNLIARCESKKDIQDKIPRCLEMLRTAIRGIKRAPIESLVCSVHLGRSDYKNNIPQRQIQKRLQRLGSPVQPGYSVKYIMSKRRAVLPSEYKGDPDLDYYSRLLKRSAFVVLQPFDISREVIQSIGIDRQSLLEEYEKQGYDRPILTSAEHLPVVCV